MAANLGNVGWHPHKWVVELWSTGGNESTIIITMTLTASTIFLLLTTGGSDMCFAFVIASPRCVGCCINLKIMGDWQDWVLARGGVEAGLYGRQHLFHCIPCILPLMLVVIRSLLDLLRMKEGTCCRYILGWISVDIARQLSSCHQLGCDGTWKASKEV